MIIISLDIYNNKIVRLIEGNKKKINYYGYLNEYIDFYNYLNFKKIHIISLDNIFKKKKKIPKIKIKFGTKIQLGGGIQNKNVIDIYKKRISFFIVGSILINNKKEFKKILSFYKKKIIFSIDCKNDYFCINGWEVYTKYNLKFMLNYLINIGIKKIIYTDISKDGTLKGIKMIDIIKFKKYSSLFKLIISGGVSNFYDIEMINNFFNYDFIVGISIYKFKINISLLC